jgi:hypothetical protein
VNVCVQVSPAQLAAASAFIEGMKVRRPIAISIVENAERTREFFIEWIFPICLLAFTRHNYLNFINPT